MASPFTWELSKATSNDPLELYRHTYDGVCAIVDAKPPRPGATFLNRVSTYDMGAGLLSLCTGTRQTLIRTTNETRRNDPELVMMSVVVAGFRGIDFQGHNVAPAIGDVHLGETYRPINVFLNDDFRVVKLMVPRAMVPQNLLDYGLHGLNLPVNTPTGHMLSNSLTSLARVATHMSPAEAEAAIRACFVMLGGALDIGGSSRHDRLAVLTRSVRNQALEQIDRTLKDSDLTPESLARRIGVSRSTLYNAFREDGGVWQQIRARRLDSAFAALRGRGRSRVSVQQIAYDNGFVSDSHFSRAFLARFGIRPGEVGDMTYAAANHNHASEDMANLSRYIAAWKTDLAA